MSTSAPRSLAEQLRSWSDQDLAHLVARRPDLAAPAPQDSAQLASRAASRPSVQRMLDQLDRLHLTTLEAALALGTGAGAEDVLAVVRADPAAVSAAVDELLAVALLWGDRDVLRPVTVLTELLPTAGDAVRPAEEVAALLAEVGPQARALLDHLEEHGPLGSVEGADRVVARDRARTPVEELLARRLLLARDARHVVVPTDVLLALRDGRTTRDDVGVPPALATAERPARLVDTAAAGAAGELVQRVELLLETWGTRPPAALRGGGLGVRDLRATGVLLAVDERSAALHVEVAAAAGLLALGDTPEDDAAWLPTEAFDAWRAASTAERWARLAAAWLESPRPASLVGTKDAKGRVVNALGDGLERGWASETRRTTLEVLATLAPGTVLAATTGAPSVVARLRWLRPRRPADRAELVVSTLEEAAVLGVVALGGVSAHGRALVAADAAPAPVLAPLLPDPVDHVLLQADLTAVAPGPLEQELAARLAAVADVESRGGATVYRFDAQTVRRAFDAGWSAEDVHAFISSASRTPVPQPLVYLVDDVARRFGTVRVGSAAAFLRSDDESTLTELVHDPRAASLRLRRIAPTVVVTDSPADVLLPRLRELGVAPVLESADGVVRLARRPSYRAPSSRRRPAPAAAGARDAARVSAVVRAVRAGDRATDHRPSAGSTPMPTTPAAVLATLRDSVESRATVWIGYVDNHGTVSERVVEPRRVDAGWLTAYDARSDDERAFALHRITAVRSL